MPEGIGYGGGVGMNALAMYGLGRDRRTQREVSSALSGGNYDAASQAAFAGGNAQMAVQLQQMQQQARQQAREAAAQMDERQRAAALDRLNTMAGLATAAIQEVPETDVDAWVRTRLPQFGIDPRDPAQPYTRADLVAFANVAEAMGGELTAARDRAAPRTVGQFEVERVRQGGQEQTFVNPQGTRALDIDQQGANTSAFEAQTARMREEREARGSGSEQQARRLAEEFARQETIFELIDQAKEQVGPLSAGTFATPAFIGGSPGANLEATLDAIRANIGFEELNRMRQMSPTGGALGQVTEQELRFLQSVLGSLERSQSPQQLRQNLDRIEQQIQESRQRVAEAYRQDFGQYPPGYQGGTRGNASSGPQHGFAVQGYANGTVIEGPDGTRYVVRNGRAEPQ